MDPRIYRGQPGLTQDFGNGDEGVDYLRRLKGAVAEGAPGDADAKGGRAPAAADSLAWQERRQSPQVRCSGSAELRTKGNDVRMWEPLPASACPDAMWK
jgi:hypothetical protein